jgi:hypothetical protein
MWRGGMLICIVLLCFAATVSADASGWLVGSAGFLGQDRFLGDAAKAQLVIASKKTIIGTNELGDFGFQLAPGRYRLIEVVGSGGKKLRIHPSQHRAFAITDGGTTRFDVMLDH